MFVLATASFAIGQDAAPAPTDRAPPVPDDVAFYLRCEGAALCGPTTAPLRDAFREFPAALVAAAVLDVAGGELDPRVRDALERIGSALEDVNVAALAGEEWIVAARFGAVPEILVSARAAPSTSDARFDELRTLFASLSDMAPGFFSIEDGERDGERRSRLTVKGTPIALALARRGGVVAISTADRLLDAHLALLAGSDAPRLLESSRVERAFEGFDADRSGELWLDIGGLAAFAAPLGAGTFARAVLDEVGRVSSFAVAFGVDAATVDVSYRLSFDADRVPGIIEESCGTRDDVRDLVALAGPDRVRGYSFSSGIELTRILDELRGLARYGHSDDSVGRSLEVLDEQLGFSLRDDFLSWFDGGGGWIETAEGEIVLVLRSRSHLASRRALRAAVTRGLAFLAERGQLGEVSDDRDGDIVVRLEAFPEGSVVLRCVPGRVFVAASAGTLDALASDPAPDRVLPLDDGSLILGMYRFDLGRLANRAGDELAKLGFLLSVASVEPAGRGWGALATRVAASLRRLGAYGEVVGERAGERSARAMTGRARLELAR